MTTAIFVGVPLPEFTSLFGLSANAVRIAIQTRLNQEGSNHLLGIDTHKFDLLEFVVLSSQSSKASRILPVSARLIKLTNLRQNAPDRSVSL